MSSQLSSQLDYVSGCRDKRVLAAQFVFNHPTYFEELLAICFAVGDQKSYKACWVLEQIAIQKIEWLQPHLDYFSMNLRHLEHESAIRPMSKVSQLLAEAHSKKKYIELTATQREQITESCFDWLITDTKVAAKCYCIRALFVLGKYNDWIYRELHIILAKDFPTQSAAYKAVSREILKKIK
ncbi:MAG: hypothetical protein ACRC6O_07995 [Flavobacterium sp.]